MQTYTETDFEDHIEGHLNQSGYRSLHRMCKYFVGRFAPAEQYVCRKSTASLTHSSGVPCLQDLNSLVMLAIDPLIGFDDLDCRYTYEVPKEEFTFWILSLGDAVEVLDPPEFRAEFQKIVRRMHRLYFGDL